MRHAARDAWDAVATAYAELLPDMTVEASLDLSVLSALVQVGLRGGFPLALPFPMARWVGVPGWGEGRGY